MRRLREPEWRKPGDPTCRRPWAITRRVAGRMTTSKHRCILLIGHDGPCRDEYGYECDPINLPDDWGKPLANS